MTDTPRRPTGTEDRAARRGGPRSLRRRVRNLLRGAGSALDIMPAPRRYTPRFGRRPHLSATAAIASDWRRVGDDLRAASERYERER